MDSQKFTKQSFMDRWEASALERAQDIDAQRQAELATCYAAAFAYPVLDRPPFQGMKLSQADVRWLLATYGDKELDLRGADLNGVSLARLPLSRLRGGEESWGYVTDRGRGNAAVQMNNAFLFMTQLNEASLRGAQLNDALLSGAQLNRADLTGAQLHGAVLLKTQLNRADLTGAQLHGAVLYEAQLVDACLNDAYLQNVYLNEAILADHRGIGPQLADVRWDGTNLAIVDWSQIKILGNEHIAQQKKDQLGHVKDREKRLYEYRTAVRANRQVAVALQTQGLYEDASRFAYRANILQRNILWLQVMQPKLSPWQRIRKFGAWLFSHLLNLLAGYGYKPERSFLAYLLVIFGFMGLYLLASHFTTPHLRWDEALVLSLSSFHGRGFFPQTITLGDSYARLAVIEAVLGLFIEVSFIATFTQRFLGK